MIQSLASLPPVYVLGGFQTDFSRHISREGKGLLDLLGEGITGTLQQAELAASDMQVVHVGNFLSEVSSQQGLLAGLVAEAEPGLSGLGASRHEAACASGSAAILAAMADLQSGRHDVALVLGIELMRHKSPIESQAHMASGLLWPDEAQGQQFAWPKLISEIGDEYARRFGLDAQHLRSIARHNFQSARKNPLAQARNWNLEERAFSEDEQQNPTIYGRIRRTDCCPVTDGVAGVVLATAPFAAPYARARGQALDTLAKISGFGHRTARMRLSARMADSQRSEYLFPHIRGSITDAFSRAAVRSLHEIDLIECHDGLSMMEYMIIDHFGFGPPGWPMQAIEDGVVFQGGRTPVNPSGGLLGVGHPIGASGIRMLWDCARQVRGHAGEQQVPHARRAAVLNVGGAATTSYCFIVEARHR